ncbi:MAG: glycosyltransferase [Flavobacteriaceae bacterium]|nr:glycosyltransferase [Flavobacteriaceae bacterium]
MKNKKTYFLISDQLGGAEQLLFQLAKNDLGNSQVCFFKSKSTDVWENENIKIDYCDGSITDFIKFCSKEKFDIVFSTQLMINAFLGFVRVLGVLKTNKLVCRESTSVFGRYSGRKLFKYKIAYWLGYRRIDLLITQSDLMKEILLQNVPYLSNRMQIETIPNLFTLPNDEILNEDIEVKENAIVGAGRLIPEKGFDILIEVFADIVKKYPEMNLVILGEGAERDKLESLIKGLDLSERVHLLGFVKNVYPYFRQAKVCVVSSRKEGFPNVLLQMMSQNERVVSTLCAGGIDKIKGVEICKANDKNELYKAIENTISKSITNERLLFDKELENRSIDVFIRSINEKLG